MTMTLPTQLSDRTLLEATVRAAGDERRGTAELVALLSEVDARRLYLGEGCASLFTYCTQVLHLSEHAAYHRIEAARTARRFPVVLESLANGALTLTAVTLLRPHLTLDNHAALLAAARHRSRREVEQQVACLAPRPDVKPLLRRAPVPSPAPVRLDRQRATDALGKTAPSLLPDVASLGSGRRSDDGPVEPDLTSRSVAQGPDGALAHGRPPTPRPSAARLAPLSPDRYLLKVTISADTHGKLRRAQDLLAHTLPDRNPVLVLDRALTLLVAALERTKLAAARGSARVSRSTTKLAAAGAASRHVPAAVKRAVWARDQGRCVFHGAHGRCTETSRLEFHHLVPFAAGGATTVENLALRCRRHNGFESERRFGPWQPRRDVAR